MPTNNRCKYKNVWDSDTKRYRVCKNKKSCGNFCIIHYKLSYIKPAIMIQKMYKGYYIRKKLKIYYNLPRDLQRKIIWHVNSDLYLRNYNSSISKLIYRRYKEFYNKYISLTGNYTLDLHCDDDIFAQFYNDLISLLNLSIKYNSIMNINKIPYLKNIKILCGGLQNVNIIYYDINNTDVLIIQKYFDLFN